MMKKEHMNSTKQTLSIATATIFHSSRMTASFSLTGEICLAPATWIFLWLIISLIVTELECPSLDT